MSDTMFALGPDKASDIWLKGTTFEYLCLPGPKVIKAGSWSITKWYCLHVDRDQGEAR